jgi:hypothetical protein
MLRIALLPAQNVANLSRYVPLNPEYFSNILAPPSLAAQDNFIY